MSDKEKKESTRYLAKAVGVFGSGVMLSRVFGLVRDIVFAAVWGGGAAMDAFAFAFKFPNMLRAFFAEGAFSAGFVPVFSQRLEKEGDSSAWDSAVRVASVLSVVVAAVAVLVAGVFLVLQWLPISFRDHTVLALKLGVRMMPYAVLICCAGALACVLNCKGRFGVTGAAPVLLNVVLIVFSLFFCRFWGDTSEQRIYGLAWGVLLAGVLQFIWHVRACRSLGFRLRFAFDPRFQDVRRVAKLMGPVMVGACVTRLNIMIDGVLALYLGEGMQSSLYYSERFAYLAVGVVGVAVAAVCLPNLSRAFARKDDAESSATLDFSLRQVLFLTAPIVAVLAVCAQPLLSVMLMRGAYGQQQLQDTLHALMFYLPGIPAFCAVKVAVTPYYASGDTATPVKIGAVCMGLNVVLNLILMQFLEQGGLALSTSICSWLNASLLLYKMKRRRSGLDLSGVPGSVLKTFACLIVAGILGGLVIQNTGEATDLLRVVLGAMTVWVVFGVTAIVLKCKELRELLSVFGKRG